MIKYKLKCKNCEKNFDSWFSSSLEFEKLKNKKFLNCHFCGSKKIDKNLMAPNILNSVSNTLKHSLGKAREHQCKNQIRRALAQGVSDHQPLERNNKQQLLQSLVSDFIKK